MTGVRVFLQVTILLLAGALATEVLLARQWQQDRLAAVRAMAQESSVAGNSNAGGDALALPPDLVPVAELRARPLFVNGRRPVSGQVDLPQPERSDDRLILTSTILTPEGGYAIIRDAASGRSITVAQGNRLGAWTLTAVAPDQVTLSSDGETRVLRLRRTQGSPGVGDGNGGAESDAVEPDSGVVREALPQGGRLGPAAADAGGRDAAGGNRSRREPARPGAGRPQERERAGRDRRQ